MRISDWSSDVCSSDLTRRHFSISWLHANNHSEIELVARIETLDDEGAFRLADLEHREREDVTDLERARNYRHAVEAYYKGVRAQMAERLAIPKHTLPNLMQLAELPDDVGSAFSEPGDLPGRHGIRNRKRVGVGKWLRL